MKVLVIGCGFLGLNAAVYLRQKGHFVTGSTRSENKLLDLKKVLDRAILFTPHDPEFWKNQDAVLFCVAPDHSHQYEETYLKNAELLLKAHPKHLIYTSSTSVYGEHEGKEVTEESPLYPANSQTKILQQTENTLLKLPQTCIFRLGELIGKGRTLESRLKNTKTFSGTGNSITNFSQLSDVIRAIHFALEKPLFGIYNLCSDLHMTRRDLYNQICKNIAWDPSIKSLHSGNKIVISEKLKSSGFKFEAHKDEGIFENQANSITVNN